MSTGKNPEAPLELKWIEEPSNQLTRPKSDEFDVFESRSLSQVFLKKTKENMFVPIGLLATTACLTMGLVNLRRGDSKKQQLFMRGRVGFQAFTLAAMTIGAVYTGRSRFTNNESAKTN